MLPDARVRQRDYLLEISRALTGELDLSKLLTMILNIAVEMLAGHAGFIALHEPHKGWNIAVSQSLPDALLRYLENWIDNIPEDSDPGQEQIPEITRFLQDVSMGLLSGVGLPLVAQEEVIGLIYIFRNYPGIFSSNDRSLLSSFANQAAIVVRNARLYTETMTEKMRMDALLDSAADGMLILTSDHKIERTNPAFARLYGAHQSQIIGKQHADILQWHKPPHGTTLEAAETDGWPFPDSSPYPDPDLKGTQSDAQAQLYVEGDLVRPNGKQPLPIGITYAPLLSREGTLINIIATVRDITRFRQADELKSIFISEVSHELKTPVALIKGYASTLRREDAHWDRTVVNDSLAVIEDEADRLTELIENLLDATRLQAGAFELKRSEISLYHVAERMVARFRIQTQDHQIINDIPQEFPIVLADETRLEQVFSNLISNAIKYAPSGMIRINSSVRSQEVIVCVTDEGPGIGPGDLPFVFERFYRSPDTSRNTKGTGLGLYLSRSIIEAHGGHMWVDPAVEKGTRICFSLPR